MRKTLTALLAATTLGVAALPSTAEARWGWGWGGFGVGLAAGAIIGGALARPYYPYYGYGYGYGYPAYYPGCYPGYAQGITATMAARDTTLTIRTGAIVIGAIVTGTERCAHGPARLSESSPPRRTAQRDQAEKPLPNCRAVR